MDNLVDVAKTRRALLKLFALSPLAALAPSLAFADGNTAPSHFLQMSRVLVGNDMLTQSVSDRIEGLLRKRDTQFDTSLASLMRVLEGAGTRQALVKTLDDRNLKFALEIAKPWYVGYVGEPSNSILKDDAEFATFLEAQSYQQIIKQVPRQSYPFGAAGWWGAVPEGVTAPPMPTEVTDWQFRPANTPKQIVDPSPTWLAYAKGQYDDVDAARQARPKR